MWVKSWGGRRGDPIVPVSPFVEIANNLLMARAWGDRGGWGMLVEAGRQIAGE